MQVFCLILMMALIAESQWRPEPLVVLHPALLIATLMLPYLALGAAATGRAIRVINAMELRPETVGDELRRLDWTNDFIRFTTLAVFMADLFVLGLARRVRWFIGDWLVISDLLTLILPIGLILWMWRVYYPIDRRLREASIIRRLDSGLPLEPIWSRGQFLLQQIRHQLLLMILPMLAMLTWMRIVRRHIDTSTDLGVLIALAGALGVFVVAPLMILAVWDTIPMPPGSMRNRLVDLCLQHKIRVRNILLWRTGGGIINGAVMGLIAPIRYILLTDGLVERLSSDQLEAVMAHELAHIRRHHMPWMFVCAFAAGGVIDLAIDTGLMHLNLDPRLLTDWSGAAINVGAWLAAVGLWIAAFGWFSRRFERQADTFAVQHLSRRAIDGDPSAVQPAAIRIMSDALLRVAELNHIRVDRPSWRHGSIAWRIAYLKSLVNCPLHQCVIDAQIRWIRRICAAVMAMLAGLLIWSRM